MYVSMVRRERTISMKDLEWVCNRFEHQDSLPLPESALG